MVAPTEVPVPVAVEAERAVIGCSMQSAEALGDAAQLLNASDFYDPAHVTVFGSLLDLAAAGMKPDPMMLFTELKRTGQIERVGGGSYLHTLMQTPATAVNVTHFARAVRHASRARSVLQSHQRLGQALLEQVNDPDALMTAVAHVSLALELLADEQAFDAPVVGLSTMDEFLAEGDNPLDWIIPGALERQDVMLLLSTEGGGKSYLCRQICAAISAGVNPFRPQVFQVPQRTLLVDLENAPSMLRRESRPLVLQVNNLSGTTQAGKMHIWRRPQGLNLRDRSDALLLERVVAETSPALVGFGSLYKSFRQGTDRWGAAAEDVIAVIDRIRARYNCAFLLEAHMPKGGGSGDRPQTAYGANEWNQWASVGRVIRKVGDNMYELNQFRGDRGVRDLPMGLIRGGELPWTSVWDEEELSFGRWPEEKRGKK